MYKFRLNKNFKFEFLKKHFFALLIWLLFFYSINVNPIKIEIINNIQFLRLISANFLTIIFIILNYKLIVFYKEINIYNKFFFLGFLTIAFFYFLSALINSDLEKNNLYWSISMFLAVIFLIFASTDKNLIKNLFVLTIIIIFSGFIFYFSITIYKIFKFEIPSIYGFSYFEKNSDLSYYQLVFGQERTPRSSGLARLALLCYLFFLIYTLKKNKFYILNNIFSIVFGSIVLILQSRTAAFSLLIISIIAMIFFFNKKKIINILLILSLIFTTFFSYIYLNKYEYERYLSLKNTKVSEENNNKTSKINNSDVLINSIIRRSDKQSFSSGRFENWGEVKNFLFVNKKNLLTGYGPQYDRKIFKQNIHNSIIYALFAGGIISSISIICLYFLMVTTLLNFKIEYFKNKKMIDSPLYLISYFYIVILGLRSLLETSFAIYSIDFLLLLISFIFINTRKKEEN